MLISSVSMVMNDVVNDAPSTSVVVVRVVDAGAYIESSVDDRADLVCDAVADVCVAEMNVCDCCVVRRCHLDYCRLWCWVVFVGCIS